MGVKVKWVRTQWSGIIPAVLSGHCDAILAGMSHTAARGKQVRFVDYNAVGLGVLVNAKHPAPIHSLADLSGKVVATQIGNYASSILAKLNTTLAAKGKAKISIETFPGDTDAAQALVAGKVDAFTEDIVICSWFVRNHSSDFKFGFNTQFAPLPEGIAIKPGNTQMYDAMSAGVNALYKDHIAQKVFKKWQISQIALPKYVKKYGP